MKMTPEKCQDWLNKTKKVIEGTDFKIEKEDDDYVIKSETFEPFHYYLKEGENSYAKKN